MKRGSVQPMTLIALAVLVGGIALAYWQYNVMKGAQEHAAHLESTVPTEEQVQEDLRRTEMELVDYQERLNHLERSVPPEAYVPTMLSELESLGKINAIQVTGVRPVPAPVKSKRQQEGEEKQAAKSYTEVDIDITGVGQYDDVLRFVDALKTFPKIVGVRTVALAPKKDEASRAAGLLECTIRLRAFVFSKPREAEPKELAQLTPAGTTGGNL